jgi:hypothetical protein
MIISFEGLSPAAEHVDIQGSIKPHRAACDTCGSYFIECIFADSLI